MARKPPGAQRRSGIGHARQQLCAATVAGLCQHFNMFLLLSCLCTPLWHITQVCYSVCVLPFHPWGVLVRTLPCSLRKTRNAPFRIPRRKPGLRKTRNAPHVETNLLVLIWTISWIIFGPVLPFLESVLAHLGPVLALLRPVSTHLWLILANLGSWKGWTGGAGGGGVVISAGGAHNRAQN